MTHPAALASDAAPRVALLLRWLVLLLMAFDLLSAPLHAHAHDMGGDSLLPQLHAASHPEDLDTQSHVEAALHHGAGHSLAALRTTERAGVAAPDLAVIVASVAGLLVQARLDPDALSARSAAADPIPIASRRSWRPEGRAPPVRHS